ncbi:DNA polymerase [Lactobacillus phage ATCC 8014-B2]|uniref:DNA polymerase n=1 Tax=Lactobacillus phage ATCC 8014-B2 TaxID=1225795 RepID=K4I212_9CAUD|nr:exonuclease [Lactobacillus phage ATCC 8014-B2]AFU63137.1 DNA polymerase [Lactobacillus phage ATCC 8014-B2]
MATYTDNKGKTHEIDDVGLKMAAKYKTELQRDNGRANWGKVARLLRQDGYDAKQCEGFRQLIKRYQYKTGTINSVEQQRSNELDHKRNALNKEIDEMLLEKRELQVMRREFNKSRRDYADMELFKRDVKRSLKDGITVVPSELDCGMLAPEDSGSVLIVSLSDIHIGAKVDVDGYKYDELIAKDELSKYASKIIQYVAFSNPGTIYIENLGDSIEGAYMRYNQSYEISLKLSDQINTAIKLISEFIINIAYSTGIPVIYSGILGNHDRANGNKKDNLPDDGFSTVLNEAIKMIVEQTDYDIKVKEPDKVTEDHISVNGANIKFVHGDLQNIAKPETIAISSQFDNIRYDALVGGHFHSLSVHEESGLVIQSGSLIGPTSYSERLHYRASRSQVMLDVSNDGTITPLPVML